jgi:hypothetical protein
LSTTSKRKVHIVNPLPGGVDILKYSRAERLVRQGKAFFDERDRLVFRCNTPEKIIAAELRLRRNNSSYSITDAEQDRRGIGVEWKKRPSGGVSVMQGERGSATVWQTLRDIALRKIPLQ